MSVVPANFIDSSTAAIPPRNAEIANTNRYVRPELIPTASDICGLTCTARILRPIGVNFNSAQVASPQTQTVATQTTSSTVNVTLPMCRALVEIQLNDSVWAALPTAH